MFSLKTKGHNEMALFKAIGSLIGGVISSNSARKASNAQSDALAQQKALYEQQAKQADYFLDLYQDHYAPLALEQVNAVKTGIDPNDYAGRVDSQLMGQFEHNRQQAERNLARQGVSANDGKWLAMQNQNALALTGQRVAQQNQARQQALDLNYGRKNQMMDYGASLAGQGSNLAGFAAQGFGNMANSYGTQAKGAATAAGYNFQQAADGLVNAFNSSQKQPNGFQTSGGINPNGSGFGGW
jgi:hypothetical protein